MDSVQVDLVLHSNAEWYKSTQGLKLGKNILIVCQTKNTVWSFMTFKTFCQTIKNSLKGIKIIKLIFSNRNIEN